MRYLPHTEEEIRQMLGVIGARSVDDLFSTVPSTLREKAKLDVPPALDEVRLMRHLAELAGQNAGADMLCFLGAGMYPHHIPPAVDQLLLRSEFYTAYTPYQPEVSQGTLQAIWEFQTMVSELYGLGLSNASLYDGASAAAEGALMARRLTGRPRVLASRCVHPEYRATVATYSAGQDSASGPGKGNYSEVEASSRCGAADQDAIDAALDDATAAVLVGYPSFLGTFADLGPLAERVHARGALLVVVNTEPYALALARSPGTLGADIVAGEGQALACPPQFGGPSLGLFACRHERRYLQQLPGRVCGQTLDQNGESGYVLTLATREQHIRRERATSNICTNQGLLALSFAIRTSLLGRQGFVAVARQCLAKAHYLESRIASLSGYAPLVDGAPFFNEFAVRVRGGDADAVCEKLERQGVIAGLALGRYDAALRHGLLIAVTETHSREDLDRLVALLDAA
jgi:glycine dehydrogenase subunit 1